MGAEITRESCGACGGSGVIRICNGCGGNPSRCRCPAHTGSRTQPCRHCDHGHVYKQYGVTSRCPPCSGNLNE